MSDDWRLGIHAVESALDVGASQVIELWIENRIMIEVLTPQMQADYVAASTPQARRAA